ncbi:MAG: S-methyl-5-thioribose-1-phosphate isomerase [Acidaminococcaceae bacterium]
MINTLEWQHSYLIILDQTKLPTEITYIKCSDYQRVALAIKRLEVRGAPAIGAAAAFAMVLGFNELLEKCLSEKELFWSKYELIKNELIAARPTAVNLQWAADKIWLEAFLHKDTLTLTEIAKLIEALAINIYQNDIEQNKKIGVYGANLLPPNANVITHCNAGSLATCGWGTALGVIRQAHLDGKIIMVYVDETRPLLQGARLTAWELLQDKIPATLITDNMAGWTMRQKRIDAVVVGADRIACNGDVANKIGTYSLAILAKAHNIPFYIAAPTTTFDFSIKTGAEIPIEERCGDELRKLSGVSTAPDNIEVFNPAFDVTPGDLISGIITDYGVIEKPYDINIAKLKARIHEEDKF